MRVPAKVDHTSSFPFFRDSTPTLTSAVWPLSVSVVQSPRSFISLSLHRLHDLLSAYLSLVPFSHSLRAYLFFLPTYYAICLFLSNTRTAYVYHFQGIVFPSLLSPLFPPSFPFHTLASSLVLYYFIFTRESVFFLSPRSFTVRSSSLFVRMVSLFPLLRLPREVISRDMLFPSTVSRRSFSRIFVFVFSVSLSLSPSPSLPSTLSSLVSYLSFSVCAPDLSFHSVVYLFCLAFSLPLRFVSAVSFHPPSFSVRPGIVPCTLPSSSDRRLSRFGSSSSPHHVRHSLSSSAALVQSPRAYA